MNSRPLKAAGLFAGIGGIELGLSRAGVETELLCEWWDPAKTILSERFPDVPLVSDVREIRGLPEVDVLAAGFPCTDLSQAGRTRGISGEASGLVGEVFRLLRKKKVEYVVLENVRNMLVLDKGKAMEFLVNEFEELGYQWAYRLVDSRFTGVPQRRQRVIFVASLGVDPSQILFSDDCGEPTTEEGSCFGFYWTEGLRGLGWAIDAVPTLKGGSSLGIPSPPAIWNPAAEVGRQLVTPLIQDAEVLQGFERDWTLGVELSGGKQGSRWKLVGNAVTVGVSTWVGRRIIEPGSSCAETSDLAFGSPWPQAACGHRGQRSRVFASMWPTRAQPKKIGQVVDVTTAPSLSRRAASGFLSRAKRGSLRFQQGFLDAVEAHVHAQT